MKRFVILIVCLLCSFQAFAVESLDSQPLMSNDVKLLPSGEFLVTNKGVKQLRKYNSDFTSVISSWDFEQVPTGVASSGTHYYVSSFSTQGQLDKIDAQTGKVVSQLAVGSGAMYPVITKDNSTLYLANQFSNTITKVDLASFSVVESIKVSREPKCFILSENERYMFVANFLPNQRSDVKWVAAEVSIIDLHDFKLVKNVKLANGANALRGITLSPDKKYVLVTHNFGRFYVPTSRLEGGWMNTSAVSVINAENFEYLGAVLLDEKGKGAAGVEGIKTTDTQIIVAHAGVHQLSFIDYKPFIEKLLTYENRSFLDYDLNFLEGMRTRLDIKGNAPRHFVIKDNKAYVLTYFSDLLNVVDVNSKQIEKTMQLQPQRVESEEFIGERIFNDAFYCLQQWQSCNGCHPGDARNDGMNWDLMNDGIGNPKSCKSLLLSYQTPPSMITGIRSSADVATRKGFEHTQFFQISAEDAEKVDIYLFNLTSVPSPYLVDGKLSEKAQKGRLVFERIGCSDCHNGTYYTDMSMCRIGDEKDIEREFGWDTPTLVEVWRTAPYLFDGRAATLKDVFETYKHGIDQAVSSSDIDALVEYVNSL